MKNRTAILFILLSSTVLSQKNDSIQRKEKLKDVMVQGKTIKKTIEQKGFAVNVIETKKAAVQSVQTNELLDHSAGVRVRMSGGLGSNANYILNGLSGNSVKIFIDGVPLRNYGPSFSLNSIPPSMIKRIEIYKGVVPAHLSDDAMGGAINIILNSSIANGLSASYSFGSFNTHQSNINGNYRNAKNGFTVNGSTFLNYSDNDYKVWGDQVAVTLSPGTPEVNITAKRFHDRYRSQGVKAEAGYTGVKWADKMLFGYLYSNMDRQIQNGATMEIVYGNRMTYQHTNMMNLDYAKKNVVKNLDVSTFGSFSSLNRTTVDTIATQYSWLGHPTNYFNNPDVWATGAEAGRPTVQNDIDNTFNARSNAAYHITENNHIQFNHLVNTFSRKSNDPLVPAIENDLRERREYSKNILALSFENEMFDNRLKTTLFVKNYLMHRVSEIRQRSGNSANATVTLQKSEVNTSDYGFGGAVSFKLLEYLTLIASAEKAVRLPEAGEVYGNVADNVNAATTLQPEKSNNYNLGFDIDNIGTEQHKFGFKGNIFIRDTKDLIMQLPVGSVEEFFRNQNVGKIFTKGFDAEFDYKYKQMLFFSANTSVFDARDYNVTYDRNGNPITPSYQRLPNTPYFTMNYNLRFEKADFIQKGSRFAFTYNVLYVHEFFRHGNILGGAGKIVIPTQIGHDCGLAYTLPSKKMTVSFDGKNLLNRQIFDNYALQKPGRAFFGKITYKIF